MRVCNKREKNVKGERTRGGKGVRGEVRNQFGSWTEINPGD